MTIQFEQPEDWARLILAAAESFHETIITEDIILTDFLQADITALHNATSRLRQTLENSPENCQHDLLNLIGAVQGYAEILYEDRSQLHPMLLSKLTTLLSTPEANTNRSSKLKPSAPRKTFTDTKGVILAVDDMQENRELICRLLSRSEHTVISAESGEEALELLETRAVDVVLLDLMMPGIGGSEVLRQMKESEELRATPVIVISGRQDMDQIITCIQAGADDYLLKPFNPVLLQARISAGIDRKRWHDREEEYRIQLERSEKFIRRTFGRYLSSEVVDQLLENPEGLDLGGDLREVTVMMSDICGFTTLAEQLPAPNVVKLLNRFFGHMTEIIFKHQGTIDEFLGDAILAVFGAPNRLDDDPERAVRCALLMRDGMIAVNASNERTGLPSMNIRIALNTGTVVAGNIGSEQRAKYGCVGHAMNVTSRIEEQTGVDEILIANATKKKLPQGTFKFGKSKELVASGLEEPILVHSVLGLIG